MDAVLKKISKDIGKSKDAQGAVEQSKRGFQNPYNIKSGHIGFFSFSKS